MNVAEATSLFRRDVATPSVHLWFRIPDARDCTGLGVPPCGLFHDKRSVGPPLLITMRINKFFTEQGLCSRREADRLIAEGRVTINGRVAKLGDHVSTDDLVARDGAVLQRGNRPVYIKYHKPVGVTTTTELHVRRNIIAEIGHAARIFPIGRLDKDSSGLILLTNDGDIVNDILRVEHGHEREYRVEVEREFDEVFLGRMSRGVVISGLTTRPCTVARLSPRRFRIILTEGRNRQIRRMCQMLGYRVVSLHRVRIMHITVEGLHAGQWTDLSLDERDGLFRALGRLDEPTGGNDGRGD